jgi:1,4-dihydroxy-2-naphthoyl-CoA synthase
MALHQSPGQTDSMRSDYETLDLKQVSEHVLLVTMNRPEVANAHNTQMGLDLRAPATGHSRLVAISRSGTA